MCAQCDAFHDSVTLANRADYLAQVDRARAAIAEGTLECVESAPELGEVRAGSAGAARHVLSCATCAQLFILEVGACDVLGDQWRPLHGN